MSKPITKKLDAEIGAAAGTLANLLLLAEQTDTNFSVTTTQRMDDVAAINARLLKRQVNDVVAPIAKAFIGYLHKDECDALESLEVNAWVVRDLLVIATKIIGDNEYGSLMTAADHYRDQVKLAYESVEQARKISFQKKSKFDAEAERAL